MNEIRDAEEKAYKETVDAEKKAYDEYVAKEKEAYEAEKKKYEDHVAAEEAAAKEAYEAQNEIFKKQAELAHSSGYGYGAGYAGHPFAGSAGRFGPEPDAYGAEAFHGSAGRFGPAGYPAGPAGYPAGPTGYPAGPVDAFHGSAGRFGPGAVGGSVGGYGYGYGSAGRFGPAGYPAGPTGYPAGPVDLSTEAHAGSVQMASLVRLGSALQDSALLPARTSLLLHLPRQPRPTKFCQMSDHRAQAYHFCDVPRLNETRL